MEVMKMCWTPDFGAEEKELNARLLNLFNEWKSCYGQFVDEEDINWVQEFCSWVRDQMEALHRDGRPREP